MAKTLNGGGRANAISASAIFTISASLTTTTVEANALRKTQATGTFSQLGGSVDANGTTRSIQFRKNSANATLVVSFTNSTAQVVYDTTHTDAMIATDAFDVEFIGVTPFFIPYFVKYVYTPTSGHVSFGHSTQNATGSTSVSYTTFSGTWTTTEAQWQCPMRAAGTLSNAAVNVSTASTSTATVRSRINGVNGTVSISVTASTTGIFEDNTHTDAFVPGDLISFSSTSHSAAAVMGVTAIITWGAALNDIFGGLNIANAFSASNQFIRLLGTSAVVATEALVKLQHGFAGYCKNMRFKIPSGGNTMTGTTTFVLRKNGATGKQVVTVGASATGTFEDTTHVDSFAATDDINYMMTGGTSGSIQTNQINLTESDGTAPVVIIRKSLSQTGNRTLSRQPHRS